MKSIRLGVAYPWVVILWGAFWVAGGWLVSMTPATQTAHALAADDADGGEVAPAVHLYFGHRDNRHLSAEVRPGENDLDPGQRVRTIVSHLVEGPRSGLSPTLAKATEVIACYLGSDGTAYVDLSADAAGDHPGGVNAELLTIYSIVNSLTLNVAEVQAVRILVDGREAVTLAGHVDITRPLKADMLIIR